MNPVCTICPHGCAPPEGKPGLCRARANIGGKIEDINYGKVTALALDPIEKKPLYRFHPGSRILSVGSFGCNLRCPFCQNSSISMCGGETHTETIGPQELVARAEALRPHGNIGIAYTYNEPLIGYEYVRDCAQLAHESGLLNVVVTNGYICEQPLAGLLPHIDAMNIDLKGFTQRFYEMVGGDLETVKRSIELAAKYGHVEVTTLVIPGENDSVDEMEELAGWLASVDRHIPYHLSRFFPTYKMTDKPPTPVESMQKLADIARVHLEHVYLGNI